MDRDEPLADVHNPYTIAALAVGKEIYLSTTLIGPAFMYTDKIRNIVSDAVAKEFSVALNKKINLHGVKDTLEEDQGVQVSIRLLQEKLAFGIRSKQMLKWEAGLLHSRANC